MTLLAHIAARLRAASGQTMSETAILMALIFLVVFGAVLIFSSGLGSLWDELGSKLPGN
jgi:Flp pilus assembly pilin Flp